MDFDDALHEAARRVEELDRLLALQDPSPAELRRTAEVLEMVDRDGEAWEYYTKAALAGDADSLAYLCVWMDEKGGD